VTNGILVEPPLEVTVWRGRENRRVFGGGLSFVPDPSVGGWIAPRLGPFGGWVASVVPREFPAYARVLHPARDRQGPRTTWSAVCAVTGRSAHPLMQWHAISTPAAQRSAAGSPAGLPWQGEPPRTGELEPETLAALCRVLAAHTDPSVQCVFALWEGYGWIHGSPSVIVYSPRGDAGAPPALPAFSQDVIDGARLRHPGRDYLLFTGPLAAAAEIGWRPSPEWFIPQSPNLFWPTNRSWCVGTEIDFDSTLVAGAPGLIHAITAAEDLEAWPVSADDSLAINGDVINT
jgi:hypothetical protein